MHTAQSICVYSPCIDSLHAGRHARVYSPCIGMQRVRLSLWHTLLLLQGLKLPYV